jgi:vitamin B12 transporter
LNFLASLYTFKQKFDQTLNFVNPPSLYQNAVFDENNVSGTGKLIWTHGIHTAVLGIDISHGALDQENDAGAFLRARGVSAVSMFSPSIDKWAVFANDTIAIGRFSVTPGIRYDHNNVSGSFVSPSLGATYKLFERTLLRASVARGFTTPPLGWTSTRGFNTEPNPSLKPEKVWSFQAGVETGITDYLWFKATAFRHELKDLMVSERISASRSSIFNRGAMRRQGMEFEAETAPFHYISLNAGYTFVRTEPPQSIGNSDIYQYNLGVKYDDRKSFVADLFGHYVWSDLPATNMAKYSAFIWDLNLRKKLYSTERTNAEIFVTAHNLFSGSQYSTSNYINPQRWLEAGLRFKF